MKSTRSALPSQVLMGRAAGYRLVDDRLENREGMQPNTGRGLGDIVTTVGDMASWEKEQRNPRLIKPETARLAHTPVKLDDGSTTEYGYGWFSTPVLGQSALSHSGQTAGFVADYLRFPERDLAIVVFASRYGAPIATRRIARLVEPGIGGPPLLATGATDPQRLEKVRQLAAGAARARSEWRRDWFDPKFWSQIEPFLLQVEENYRRRGSLQSIMAVGPNGVQDPTRPAFRVVFEKLTRVMTVEFDEQNRIKAFESEDE
jgi:CubicO group peptidase (beta-lactamase class C family)